MPHLPQNLKGQAEPSETNTVPLRWGTGEPTTDTCIEKQLELLRRTFSVIAVILATLPNQGICGKGRSRHRGMHMAVETPADCGCHLPCPLLLQSARSSMETCTLGGVQDRCKQCICVIICSVGVASVCFCHGRR